MPGILHSPLDRRRFIGHSAAALVGLAGATAVRLPAAEDAPDKLKLALLSDTHTPRDPENAYRGFKPWHNLKRIAPDVAACGAAGAIINGDAARLEGFEEDYTELRGLLAPIVETTPVYVGLGNHDHRGNFFKVFGEVPGDRQPVNGKHVVVLEHPSVRVLVLDSLLYVDKVAGLLGENQRNWMESFLAKTDNKPTVLFIHHTLGDGDGDLLDSDRLFQILAPNPNVKAIFYGHSHRYDFSKRQGVHLINLPAVGYNFRDSEPVGWVESTFDSKGVDLKLHAFAGNTRGDGKTTRVDW